MSDKSADGEKAPDIVLDKDSATTREIERPQIAQACIQPSGESLIALNDVKINHDLSVPVVFMLPPTDGSLDALGQLAKRLSVATYGLAWSIHSSLASAETIEQVADYYLSVIKSATGAGQAIVLIGYSFGGSVAAELSRRLLSADDLKLTSLILLDYSPKFVHRWINTALQVINSLRNCSFYKFYLFQTIFVSGTRCRKQ